MNWQKLQKDGYITLKVFDEAERLRLLRELQCTVARFQEYKTMEKNGLVMGGFGAFGNPSSFHNPWVRKIRKKLHPVILDKIFREHLQETGLKFEQDIDRMMIRTPYQTVGKESWHRDESKYAKPGDTIFGGWVNFDAFPHYLSACPGTHMEPDAQRKNKGFARIGKKDYPRYEKLKQNICVPPGHILIFFERMVHEVRGSKGQTIHRLFMGWRTTRDNEPLLKNGSKQLHKALADMAVMPIKSGQTPQMYSGSHWNFHRQKVQDWSERIADQCKEHRTVQSGKEQGKVYTNIVHQRMKSMREYGFDMYPPYEPDEISILMPRKVSPRAVSPRESPAKKRRLI